MRNVLSVLDKGFLLDARGVPLNQMRESSLVRFPTCDICLKEVDAIEAPGIDENPPFIDVRARCHGAEDVIRVTRFSADTPISEYTRRLHELRFFRLTEDTNNGGREIGQ